MTTRINVAVYVSKTSLTLPDGKVLPGGEVQLSEGNKIGLRNKFFQVMVVRIIHIWPAGGFHYKLLRNLIRNNAKYLTSSTTSSEQFW